MANRQLNPPPSSCPWREMETRWGHTYLRPKNSNSTCLASCATTFSWWKRLGPTSTKWLATTGNGHLLLVSDLTSSSKCRNPSTPGDPVSVSLSQVSVHVFTTDPQRLWDFLEWTGVVTHPLNWERDRNWELKCNGLCNIKNARELWQTDKLSTHHSKISHSHNINENLCQSSAKKTVIK